MNILPMWITSFTESFNMLEQFQPLIGSQYVKELVQHINNAKMSIDILMYDWRWYPDNPQHALSVLNSAFVRAVQRGVQVRAVVNSRQLVPPLLGVGIKAKTITSGRVLHSKLILIDGKTLVIGSHNLTRNACNTNLESSLVVSIPEGEQRFAQYFENIYVS